MSQKLVKLETKMKQELVELGMKISLIWSVLGVQRTEITQTTLFFFNTFNFTDLGDSVKA